MTHYRRLEILRLFAFFNLDRWAAVKLFGWKEDIYLNYKSSHKLQFHAHNISVPIYPGDYEKVRLLFEPRDIWMGVYIDTDKQRVYVMLLPMLGFIIYYG